MDFELDKNIDLSQVSITGIRAILLIGLLSSAPHSLEEVKQKLIEQRIVDKSQSNDIIRIDLSTIKSFGCEVSRSCVKTNYKYVLSKHPFTINITKDDIKSFKCLLDKIKNTMSVHKLLEYDQFLKKISKYIYEDEIKEALLGISPLKHYNIDTLKDLMASCTNNYTVKLMYLKSYAKNPAEKNIIAQKLVFKNDKLYLYGYDLEKKDSVTLLFNRIKSVESKKLTEKNYIQNPYKVKFSLKNCNSDLLQEEKIQSRSSSGYIIEGNYFNEFLAVQRILSLGAQCTVIEPVELRNKIISKLKEMRKLYEKKQ